MLNRAATAGPGGREMFVPGNRWDGSARRRRSRSLAVYLASDEGAFTTGVAHVIDGGWTL